MVKYVRGRGTLRRYGFIVDDIEKFELEQEYMEK